MRRRDSRGFDERIYDEMLRGVERAMAAGLSRDEAIQVSIQAMHSSLETSTPRVVTNLKGRAPRMLRRARRLERGFQRRLRTHWGTALNIYYMVLVCAEEAGRNFAEKQGQPADEQQQALTEALHGLHARACRTALEVHHLLCGGFPRGALSRCRTLHEIAATAIVIAEHCQPGKHPDLAERYIAHHDVTALKDAMIYQEQVERLGYEPFTTEDLAAIDQRRDAAVEKYGDAFRGEYGWASGVDGLTSPTFRDIEQLANLAHLRPHYRWASHEIHPDSMGLRHNVLERGGVTFNLAGATNVGLGDPGHLALISLHQSMVSLLLSPEDKSPEDLLVCQVVQALLDEAGEAFLAGEESVQAAEDRFQASLADRESASWLPATRARVFRGWLAARNWWSQR